MIFPPYSNCDLKCGGFLINKLSTMSTVSNKGYLKTMRTVFWVPNIYITSYA